MPPRRRKTPRFSIAASTPMPQPQTLERPLLRVSFLENLKEAKNTLAFQRRGSCSGSTFEQSELFVSKAPAQQITASTEMSLGKCSTELTWYWDTLAKVRGETPQQVHPDSFNLVSTLLPKQPRLPKITATRWALARACSMRAGSFLLFGCAKQVIARIRTCLPGMFPSSHINSPLITTQNSTR